jgi:hypothetical protein
MSDQSTKIAARRVDTGVAVIGVGPTGLGSSAPAGIRLPVKKEA